MAVFHNSKWKWTKIKRENVEFEGEHNNNS